MHVTSATLRLALSRLLRDRNAQPGELVLFSEMEQVWAHTGLRLSDLRDAVRVLMEDGVLQPGERGNALAFSLTAEGHGQLYRAELTIPALVERAVEEWTLVRARTRQWTPSREKWDQRREADQTPAPPTRLNGR